MQNKLELPIETTAEVFGKNVECQKIDKFPCHGCVFEHIGDIECENTACTPDERTDKEFIILAEV
jgi:hypothetical protein